MPATPTIRVDAQLKGIPQLRRDLTAIGYDLGRRINMTALRAGAKYMLPFAVAAAPIGTGPARYYKGKPHAPGTLKQSFKIQTRKSRDGDRVNVRMGPTRDVFYGRWTEYGTKHIAPQGWFRAVFETTKDGALEKIGKSYGRALRKYERKHGTLPSRG